MKIAVLGSGNGALAVAFEWSKAGHEVYLFDFETFPKVIQEVAQAGGIYAEGELEGFQPIAYAGHDIETVLKGADIVFAVGPAYSTEPFAKACRDVYEPNQIFVICPSSCAGALVFKRGLGLDINDDSVIIAETSTLPYAVRIIGPAKIAVYNRLKGGYYMAALPSKFTQQVYDMLSPVYKEILMADNTWQTTLQNGNPVIHPAVTLLNAGLIERTKGDFLFYEEGVTVAVGRLIEAVDKERIAIGEALGVKIYTDPDLGMEQGYMLTNDYNIGYSKAPGFKGIMAQSSLDNRYLTEDAGYGLVFLIDLAKLLEVATPNMEAILTIASTIMATDYKAQGARTTKSLGLDIYTKEELRTLL